MQTALIVLAAGSSNRLGESKQLLRYEGQTLLLRSLAAAINAGGSAVVCVYSQEKIKREIEESPLAQNINLTLCENSNWQEGLASSICCGLKTALKAVPELDSAMFMTCDQPYVTKEVLVNLLTKFQTRQENILIAASAYENTLGIPAIFAEPLFEELLELVGDKGAKAIIMKNRKNVLPVEFAKGHIDIDTREQYEKLTNEEDCS